MLEGLKSIADEMQEQARQNTKSLILFFVSLIILGVVGFCEILYVAMIIPAFPDGLVRSVGIAGACATGASAVVLLVGKLHWFSKGKQSFVAWGFVGVETFILAMNVLLAVQLHNGHVADWLLWWEQMYPAAPLAAFVGWGLILFFDKDNEMRTVKRENKERQERKELDYENLVHHTTLAVKHESLQILAAKLRDKIASSQYQQGLDVVADQIANGVLGQISGSHITSLLPAPSPEQKTVEGTVQPLQMPQQASVATPPPSQQTTAPSPQPPPFSFSETLEHLYNANPALFAQFVQAAKDANGPLASPPLDATQASQTGMSNGNGHQK